VLKFSPAGDNLKQQLRKYPCLVRCCQVDFYPEWPNDGLLLVANQFLADVEIDEKFRRDVIGMCPVFHQEAIRLSERYMDEVQRRNYTTPTTYLEFIRTFKRLLARKRREIVEAKGRYTTGIEKLEFAEAQIKVGIYFLNVELNNTLKNACSSYVF
jgi:dynein heavy chain